MKAWKIIPHKTLTAGILAIMFSALTGPILAGPLIVIKDIDAGTAFPEIRVRLSLKNPSRNEKLPVTESNLQIFEDGYAVQRIKLSPIAQSGDFLYLVFSFDSSRSIKKSQLAELKKAAREIITAASPDDKIALYRFNDKVVLLRDFATPGSDLVKNIEDIRGRGNRTLLYNAIYESLERLKNESGGRRAVIVFTDGKDEGSSFSSDDIVNSARETGIPVHFICTNQGSSRSSVERIARLTGGKLLSAGARGCPSLLLTSLSGGGWRDYEISYTSIINPENKTHRLEARLTADRIMDRDTMTFFLPRRTADIRIPGISEIMLITLILVLIVLLSIIIVIIIRNSGRILLQPPGTPAPEPWRPSALEHWTRSDHPPAPRTLTPEDPEYAYSRAWLLQKDGPQTGKKFPIFWEELSLGRDEENTIVINDGAVSPKHARIKRIRDTYLLFDLISENGTLLNGKKLLRPRPLHDWDEIRIGRTVLIFRGSKISE